ncbi:MAG: leucyl aminopeptidase family protein [Deltaproteobacteria bacterium]|nr:leucyl aminopeptidase family protein [Deltaproteobacteria bacterium]
MKRSYTRETIENCTSPLIIVPYIQQKKNLAFIAATRKAGQKKSTATELHHENFKGNFKELLQTTTQEGARLFVIGLGKAPLATQWREAMAKCIRIATQKGISSCTIYLDDLTPSICAACIEGVTLTSYQFHKYKTAPPSTTPIHVKLGVADSGVNTSGGSKIVKTASIRADAVTFCRDLVNEPANKLNVSEMVALARKIARDNQLRCKVISGPMLEKKGFGLIHAVGKGAEVQPALIELEYSPEKSKGKRIALVGKGVVFDSGGLCLKPAASMVNMKTDMAGAALVLSVMNALRSLNVEHAVTAYIPLAENAIGNTAFHPGDIIFGHAGKTIEITNTDAEGRLLLADALSLATEHKHDEIIDFATLTGACAVALGKKRGAIFSGNAKLEEKWLETANSTGELIWPLPLADELEKEIKSEVADLKNSGDRFGGTISAALFLRQFTDAKKWVHFDIAGPARNDSPNLLCPKGGTGFLVLTVLDYLRC